MTHKERMAALVEAGDEIPGRIGRARWMLGMSGNDDLVAYEGPNNE